MHRERDIFYSPEQKILIKLYKYKDITTKTGNTSAINKAQEASW